MPPMTTPNAPKTKKPKPPPASDALQELCALIAGPKPAIPKRWCRRTDHLLIGPKVGYHDENAGRWLIKCNKCIKSLTYLSPEPTPDLKVLIEHQQQDDRDAYKARQHAATLICKDVRKQVTLALRSVGPGDSLRFTLSGNAFVANGNGDRGLGRTEIAVELEDWRANDLLSTPAPPPGRKAPPPLPQRGLKRPRDWSPPSPSEVIRQFVRPRLDQTGSSSSAPIDLTSDDYDNENFEDEDDGLVVLD